MSKSIEALRNKSGNIFWPATASDAVIHPKTKKTLTEHITRYDLTEYDTVTSLETGIQKLIGDKSNGGLGITPKEGDRILVGNWDKGDPKTRLPGATEYIYFSEGELDESGDNYYEYPRCWTEICYDTSDIPRLSSEGRLFSENSPIMILNDINVNETHLNDSYLIRANLGKYCHLISFDLFENKDFISKVINSGDDYVYHKIEKPDTKTIYYSISDDKFYRFIPRSGKTGGMEEIGPKEITGVSINGVIATPNTLGVINLGTIENLQEITWSVLKTLRDGGNLEPGKFYRITDYTCTTTQTDTQSAGHVFDIIVLALSESTLSETAWADHHEGDTYFTNCKLEAWELKYCLDNDTTRFKWADSTNGKGVIYYMKDEWENEAPYDFKNIQFKRQLTNGSLDIINGTNTWCYTFNYWNSTTSASEDLVMYNLTSYTQYGQTDYIAPCIRNKLGRTVCNFQTTPFTNYNIILSNIVFLCTEIIGDSCRDNYFENQCYNITFGSCCCCNTFKYNCRSITFGNNCRFNNFSEQSNFITLGENSSEINVKENVSNISIANNCRYISIGADCRFIILSKNYTYNLTVGDGNQYITITSSLTTTNTGAGALRKIYIAPHTNITTTMKTISHNSLGDTFLTTYKPANSVEISV